MEESARYVLGQSERAAHRLAIQDEQFAEVSERLLDELDLKPAWRVVELGCGPGGFSRRILRRLGPNGILVAVDSSAALLEQATSALSAIAAGRFEPVCANIAELGPWLAGADAVVCRTVLHHVPMVELMLGRLRASIRPGTRIGFIEPDFRGPLGRIGYLEATGRTEMAALRVWAFAINQLYLARRISPEVGASLARTLELAGYRNVRADWTACPATATTLENMAMFYEEVRDKLAELGILSVEENDRQRALLVSLKPESLPPAWGTYRVTCEA
jgi:ubiquinone/menaquinone biosynthesis C-methylase UbiE